MRWIKSSASNNGHCVTVACANADEVWVRDSKLGDASPILRVPVPAWWSFLAAVKTNQVLTYRGVLWVGDVDGGWLVWLRDEPDVVLSFDRREVDAFVAGVEAGDFDVARLVASGTHGSDGTGRVRASVPPVAVSEADSAPI
ncbi:DUF397 domain-containing protein [Nonomuraea guangzhouensis]|uniref:DUF397 domain-containing protein n=1 Tax=Nonomuraea guangzhouensis TaxID=1291555 RepID=A0ABW4GWM5_9ACTN|nr:DUF397 domain-containing protein [Nonomuraea guangzhouensis]